MAREPKLDIPNELRSFAEQSVDQARSAIDNLFGAAHKAFSDAERRIDEAQEGARQIGRTSVGFAEENIAASFEFAARLAHATSLEEWRQLQADFVTRQAARLSEQAQLLARTGIGAGTVATEQAAETVSEASKAAAAAQKEAGKRVAEAQAAASKLASDVPEVVEDVATPAEPAPSAPTPEPPPAKAAAAPAAPVKRSPSLRAPKTSAGAKTPGAARPTARKPAKP